MPLVRKSFFVVFFDPNYFFINFFVKKNIYSLSYSMFIFLFWYNYITTIFFQKNNFLRLYIRSKMPLIRNFFYYLILWFFIKNHLKIYHFNNIFSLIFYTQTQSSRYKCLFRRLFKSLAHAEKTLFVRFFDLNLFFLYFYVKYIFICYHYQCSYFFFI